MVAVEIGGPQVSACLAWFDACLDVLPVSWRRSGRLPTLPPRPAGLAPALFVSRHPLGSSPQAPPLWWVGCHGGAGTSTLAAVTGLGADGERVWPNPVGHEVPVVLVCRLSAAGTWAATGAVEQWYRRYVPPGIRLLGLVAVAASAKRAPNLANERLELIAGWLPKIWRVGWVETFLATDTPAAVGMPPDVAALRHDLDLALQKTREGTADAAGARRPIVRPAGSAWRRRSWRHRRTRAPGRRRRGSVTRC